jgi:hypothetical protein
MTEYKMTFYAATLDLSTDKMDHYVLYAYPASSEVAFLSNMRYWYHDDVEKAQVHTDYFELYQANQKFFEVISPEICEELACRMNSNETSHYAINLSIYKDKE